MAKVFLKKKISNRIAEGHPWIYKNEIGDVVGEVLPGDIVDVFSSNGSFVGCGYYNPNSQIQIRLLSHQHEEINDAFFQNKIQKAWAYRQVLGYTENCRLVFGEADELPGLIIDKFNDYFVLQIHTLGMEQWKASIVNAIQNIFKVKGIYERNDVPVRTLEGLEIKKGFLTEAFDTTITIQENDIQMLVDIENGQRTGYYLDQQDNRKLFSTLAKDKEVLDVFCYTGAFAIHAAKQGARKVWGIDYVPDAIKLAQKNAALNAVSDICNFECRNGFDVLKAWVKENKQVDIVILDPPAFAKHKDSMDKAISGYKEINLRAMKLIKKGGFLVTCSNSNLLRSDLFLKTLQEAALDAKRQIKQVVMQSQSADHPIIWTMPNTQYLKFLILQVQ